MIQYNSGSTGLTANVENIRTKERFLVSTVQNPIGIYETAVLRAGGLWGMIKNMSKPLYVVNSSSLSQAKQTHIQTAELFEQLNPKDLMRKYKSVGIGGFQQILTKDDSKEESLLNKNSDLLGVKRDTSGKLVFDLTEEEQQEVRILFDGFKDYVFDPMFIDEFQKSLTAQGLFHYAQNQIMLSNSESNKKKFYIEKAIASISKAYSICPLPIYMYDLACYMEIYEDYEGAKDIFLTFLELQNEFEPNKIQKMFLDSQKRDMVKVIEDARSKAKSSKDISNGDKVIVDGEQYIIDDATPEDIQRDVLGKQIFESNPIQWFKNVSDFFNWSEVAKEDEDLKLVFIIILCASMTTKSIKNLYEKEVEDKKLKSDLDSDLFKWSNVFLESIYFYSHTLNFPNKFETDLINLLANVFNYGSSDEEKLRVEKSMVNDCQVRKNEYLNYKGNSSPAYLYQKAIGKSLGIINPIFTTLACTLSLKQLNRYMEFYKTHLIGKEVNLEKIIEILN